MTDKDDIPGEAIVSRNDERMRYEITVGDTVGGFLQFEQDDEGHVVLPHTEVDPAYKGQGLGSKLASEALADLARRGEVVVPTCPFLVSHLKENEVAGLEIVWPEEEDAIDSASPSEPA